MIVDKALRRFSEDRTGMSDFALESGGQNRQVRNSKAILYKMLHVALPLFQRSIPCSCDH